MESVKVSGEKLNETVVKRAMKISSSLNLEILHSKNKGIKAFFNHAEKRQMSLGVSLLLFFSLQYSFKMTKMYFFSL